MMKKRVLSFVMLFFLLVSEPGSLAIAGTVWAISTEDISSPDRVQVGERIEGSSFPIPQLLDSNSEPQGPPGKLAYQLEAASISPTLDRDFDGMIDSVEEAGWRNAIGLFVTDPLNPDIDGDGLVDGKEKLYDSDPLDKYSPGIYVEYEDQLMTRQYYATEPRAHLQMVYPYPWGWQQYGDHLISFTAVVVRRGSSFSVGGPIGASLQITKSLGSLTNLSYAQDPCTGRWRISVPSSGTVGTYGIVLQDGEWSKSLKLHVIFELPTPTSGMTQAMIDTFLYDDNRDNTRDERTVLFGDFTYDHGDSGYSWIPTGSFINAGGGYSFSLQQFEPFVFETHVMRAINGRTGQWDAAVDLIERVDQTTRFNNPRPLFSSWNTLHPGLADDSNQCSNIAGLVTAFARSAGIPSRAFFVDWYSNTFDHADELWINGTWYSTRGYAQREDACVYDENQIVWDCAEGITNLRSRTNWGRYVYRPWHLDGTRSGSAILTADETWGGNLGWGDDEPMIHDYRWASWDWDGVIRYSWFDTLFVPYWVYWGWGQEPQILGSLPGSWPTVRDFTVDASPDSRTVAQGESTTFAVSADTSDGFSNPVQFVDQDGNPRVTGVPANTTIEFSIEQCVPDCSSTLTVITTPSTPAGTYQLTITGRGHTSPRSYEGWYRDTTVTLIVTPQPDFTITALPGSASVVQSSSANFTVNLDALDGFSENVGLSVTGVPMSTTASFAPNATCTPTCSRVLSLDAAADAPVGTHTVTIHGDSGSLHHTTTVYLTIDASVSMASTQAVARLTPSVQIASTEVLDKDSVPVPATSPFVSRDTTHSDGWLHDSGPAGLAVRGIGDQGVDLDGDGYFDQLVVEIEAMATQPGTYWFQGQLGIDGYDSTLFVAGGLIDTAVVRADLVAGINKVRLAFDGLRIFAAKVDGPYLLKYLSVTNVDEPGPTEFVNDALEMWSSVYETSPYQADEFQNRGAALAEQFIEHGIDEDSDSLYESLILEVPLRVYSPGTYTVRGDLVDEQGQFVAQATWTGSGDLAHLQFDGLAGTVGPYALQNVVVLNADGTDVDSTRRAYTTQMVVLAEEKTHIVKSPDAGMFDIQGILLSGYSDYGWDDPDDSDTLYDLLIVNVPVDIESDGVYHLEGWLGKDGSLITWGSSESYTLLSGTQRVISVTFSGPAIHSYNTDGPFDLVALKLMSGTGYVVADELPIAYTTSAYTHDQFESLPYYQASANETIFVLDDVEEDRDYYWEVDSPWARVTEQRFSPVRSWTDSPGNDYANGTDASLTTVPFAIGKLSWPVLQFRTCYAFEDNYDYGYVETSSDDGQTWTQVAEYTGKSTHWTKQVQGLGAIEPTDTFQVRFRLKTDAGLREDGWYIDNVLISYDIDMDNDGILNEVEVGSDPHNPVDTDGDGTPDYLDTDSDDPENNGIPDAVEVGDPDDPVDTDGDGVPDYQDENTDGDGIPDEVEAGDDPNHPVDTDGDGLPDYRDQDSDNDGIPDSVEAGDDPENPVDSDGDGIPDYVDENSDNDDIPDSVEAGDDPGNPVDSDGDGIPDYVDEDSDNDGIPDSVEAGDDPENPADTDGDGIPDYVDEDSDNDGIPDEVEAGDDPENPADTDGDGTPDYVDEDSDNDGIPDSVEAGDDPENPVDSDGDGTPDYMDEDSDNDDIPDSGDAFPTIESLRTFMPLVFRDY
ncbi:MAG: hypothetical protein JXA89_21545 [Anaerolineae bacterium]|nr:hypothetical protein [Anaerolineae bacterium]